MHFSHIYTKKRAKVLHFFDMCKFFYKKMRKIFVFLAYVHILLYLCTRFRRNS